MSTIEQDSGTAYDEVTIRGKFFGTKKGAVYLEYGEGESLIRESCKITKWWMDRVTNTTTLNSSKKNHKAHITGLESGLATPFNFPEI